jgi:hypothetical protein
MAKAFGQDPVQVPHWIQAWIIARTGSISSCARAVFIPASADGVIQFSPPIYLVFDGRLPVGRK